MQKIVPFAVAAAALFATTAHAGDLLATSNGYTDQPPLVQNVRMVCNEYGRCWRERERRVIIDRDAYDYAPRERYIERRDYYDEPRAGVGIHVPGANIGVGVDRW